MGSGSYYSRLFFLREKRLIKHQCISGFTSLIIHSINYSWLVHNNILRDPLHHVSTGSHYYFSGHGRRNTITISVRDRKRFQCSWMSRDTGIKLIVFLHHDASKHIEKLITSGHEATHTKYCEPAFTLAIMGEKHRTSGWPTAQHG